MKRKLQPPPQLRGTAAAPLLYWLAVVCGLAGMTLLRISEPREYVPVWFGSIVGISIGQLLAVLRLRIWIIGVVGFMLSWFLVPASIFVLVAMFGDSNAQLEPVLMSLIPAAICGYASLSERGGLLAFWYPTMLWMLVILDGAAPGSFSPNKSLPLVVGLATLFVGYLRARESRRVALWQAHGTTRLAQTSPRMVVRASPMRGIGQLAWTGMIGGGAFLLAATIAPKMWQKDREVRRREEVASLATYTFTATSEGPCCPDPNLESERIREYLPIHGYETRASYDATPACHTCSFELARTDTRDDYGLGPGVGVRRMDERWSLKRGYSYDANGNLVWSWDGDAYDPLAYYGDGYVGTLNGSSTYNGYTGYPTSVAPAQPYIPPVVTNPAYVPPVVTTPAYVPPVVTSPAYVPPVIPAIATDSPPPAKPPTVTSTKHGKVPAPPAKPVVTPAVKPAPVVTAPPPKPPTPASVPLAAPAPAPAHTPNTNTPWGLVLPLLLGAFAFPLAWRILRRNIAVRHLARPFWRESIDQQVSNHWQRMLVGLRDAGIHLRTNEQPQAFAKRVGIAGMDVCATVLERVRHGVRIDADDLAAMDAAATAIYRTARVRAGIAGRVAGSFRWPLV